LATSSNGRRMMGVCMMPLLCPSGPLPFLGTIQGTSGGKLSSSSEGLPLLSFQSSSTRLSSKQLLPSSSSLFSSRSTLTRGLLSATRSTPLRFSPSADPSFTLSLACCFILRSRRMPKATSAPTTSSLLAPTISHSRMPFRLFWSLGSSPRLSTHSGSPTYASLR